MIQKQNYDSMIYRILESKSKERDHISNVIDDNTKNVNCNYNSRCANNLILLSQIYLPIM